MYFRDDKPPLDDRGALTTALRDLAEFVGAEQNAGLALLTWYVSGGPAGPSVHAVLMPEHNPAALDVVRDYADAINVQPVLKREAPDRQSFVAYRADAINGRTEMYVSLVTPVDCVDEPPGPATAPTLLAERAWETKAEIMFRRDVTSTWQGKIGKFYAGDTRIMVQWGRALHPVGSEWLTSFDEATALSVPADAVEVVRVLSYTSPLRPWGEVGTTHVDVAPGREVSPVWTS